MADEHSALAILAPHLLNNISVELVLRAYGDAPGNEIASGKFASPESSAALAANTFGPYLDKPERLPRFPKLFSCTWPAIDINLEAIVRFPWTGGRHPCLDALVTFSDTVVGFESKRYEPFRTKTKSALSEAYWRPVWGTHMRGYERVRDMVKVQGAVFQRLDAAQLVKHAFGLRTFVTKQPQAGKRAVLYYLFAEPKTWPDGRCVDASDIAKHREEVQEFANLVADNEVEFVWSSYSEVLAAWCDDHDDFVREHANALVSRFAP